MEEGDQLMAEALRANLAGHEEVHTGRELEKTGGREDVLCNVYFSTMRAATDKRS